MTGFEFHALSAASSIHELAIDARTGHWKVNHSVCYIILNFDTNIKHEFSSILQVLGSSTLKDLEISISTLS